MVCSKEITKIPKSRLKRDCSVNERVMGEQRMDEINNGNNITKFPIVFVNLKTEEINNGTTSKIPSLQFLQTFANLKTE